MNITQIRNAAQLITYAGKRFLIDQCWRKGTYPGFRHGAGYSPTDGELPVDVQTLLMLTR